MTLHRPGEGLWARGIALVGLLVFVIWGAVFSYAIPARQSKICVSSDVLTDERLNALLEFARTGGPQRLKVSGLTNAPVDDGLVGKKVTETVRGKGGSAIVRQGIAIEKAAIAAMRDAGIKAVPVEGTGLVDVTDVILNCRLKTAVNQVVPNILVPSGHQVADDADRQRLIALLVDAKVAAEAIQVEAADGRRHALDAWDKLVVGMKFPDPVNGPPKVVNLAAANDVVDAALYEKFKAAKVTQVEIDDVGELELTAERVPLFYGRMLVANETVAQDTWWTRGLAEVPGVGVRVNAGGLACAAGALLAAMLVWRLLNRPTWVEFLIDTQQEMRKVSWPTSRELTGSSGVVIAFIMVMALFLWGTDIVLGALSKVIKLYPSQ